MKKIVFIFALLFGASLLLQSCYRENSEVRIRIIAQDNSEEAQEFKMLIKDKVITCLKEIEFKSFSQTTDFIRQSLKEYDYIRVEFVDEYFPAKSLNGQIVPAGVYQTIKITIGEGKGTNWWSILYPEFFGVTYEDSNNIEYKSYFYDSIFG